MQKIDFKLFGIILSFIIVLFLASNFKKRLDKLNDDYYEMTQVINDIRFNWHTHMDILKESIIFLRYSNDNILNHMKDSKKLIIEVAKKENLKEIFPKVYINIDKYIKESNKVKSNTEKFLRANAKIKNSLFILERNLNDIENFSKEYNEKFIQTVTKFMSIKNNFDENNNISTELFEYLEKTKDLDDKYKLNFMHIKVLYEEIPKFKQLFTEIDKSELNNLIKNMFYNLIIESNDSKENMKNLFLIIFIAYIIFFFLILFLYIQIKTDTIKIISLEKQKQQDSRIDKLTNLLNRNAFVEDTKDTISSSIVLLDITEFSNINSIAGYDGGDYILKEISNILININKYGIGYKNVYRVESDHFAIILSTQDKDYIKSIILEIINNIENSSFDYEGLELPVYLQAGISQSEPYLNNAELAIQKTKNSFEKVSFLSEEIDIKKQSIANIGMLIKVKDALKNNRIKPFFQPIVDLKTKEIVKYEALVRLINDDGKVIVPYFFLDLTKKSKLYSKITKLVIAKSIDFIRQENISVSINISYQDIRDKNTLEYISQTLEKNKDISSLVTFELLENEEIENYDVIYEFIEIIKMNGCKLAIDDFGSGYSNFTHLFNMKPDILKIDGTLIKDINTNINSRNIVKAMIMLAKESGMQTVAEFVDCKEVDELITNLGLDYGQGYFYSQPVNILEN